MRPIMYRQGMTAICLFVMFWLLLAALCLKMQNGHMQAWCNVQDGVYVVWEHMQRAKVVPDQITQRLLASSFGNNPQLEAKALQASCDSCLLTCAAALYLFLVKLITQCICKVAKERQR